MLPPTIHPGHCSSVIRAEDLDAGTRAEQDQVGNGSGEEGSLSSRRSGFCAWAMVGATLLCAAAWPPLRIAAQRGGLFLGSADDPAIQYSTAPLNNAVDDLNRSLQDGSVSLTFEGRSGYLRSAIDALKLQIDSQLLVFSKGSLQGRLVEPTNPRSLFFSDRVALGWVRDAELLEVAAHDEREGVVFYSLEQRPSARPVFKREFRCLGCHMTGDTLGVPGLLMFSSTRDSAGGGGMKVVATDHRTPYAERFGGMVRDGQPCIAPSPWQRCARARTAQRRGTGVRGGSLRRRRLPGYDKRRRRSADLVAPGADDQSADARVVGGASRRSGVSPGRVRAAGCGGDADERHLGGGGRLHAVCRRTAAPCRNHRAVRLFSADVDERTTRSPRTVAVRDGPDAATHEISVQLSDLLAGVRRITTAGKNTDLPAIVAGAFRRGDRRPLSRAVAARSTGDRRDPERHEARSSRVLHRGGEMHVRPTVPFLNRTAHRDFRDALPYHGRPHVAAALWGTFMRRQKDGALHAHFPAGSFGHHAPANSATSARRGESTC